nr:ubiquitin-like-specific protease 1 [Lolium perenne]
MLLRDVVTKDASTGAKTVEKKTRYKRAAKGELSPPKLKKIKVSQDVVRKYDKYVSHGRKFKRKKKNEVAKEFLKIGRFFCSYKSFIGALRPRQYLSNVVMAVWTEKFNHAAKASAEKNPRNHKRYAFSPYFAEKLAVETSTFDPASVMKEFKIACSKFKILKDDMLYLPIVQADHWIVCCINLLCKQFHIFDSMMPENGVSSLAKAANNLFSNFVRTANESKVSWVDFGKFKETTPDHPQQDTLYDCGFYSILYMEHFNGKVMPNFENDVVPDFRRLLAASLIDNRDNQSDDVDVIMNEDLQQG